MSSSELDAALGFDEAEPELPELMEKNLELGGIQLENVAFAIDQQEDKENVNSNSTELESEIKRWVFL